MVLVLPRTQDQATCLLRYLLSSFSTSFLFTLSSECSFWQVPDLGWRDLL